MPKTKTYLTVFFLVISICASAQDCTYVSEKGGTQVMSKPDHGSEVVGNLEYGKRVKIFKRDINSKKNPQKESKWMLVYFGERGCHYIDDHEENHGYILEKSVSKNLEEIPPKSLYHYYSLELGNRDYAIQYYEEKSNYRRRTGCCYQYYGPNMTSENEPDLDIPSKTEEEIWYLELNPATDTLKSYFTLEIVEKGNLEPVKNPYRIDTTPVHRIISKTWENPKKPIGKFYLYLNEDKDSLLVPDKSGTAFQNPIFTGQIPKLNQYVINHHYEMSYHILYDKTTGNTTPFSNGVPYISPDGKYVVDFAMLGFGYNENILTISKLGENLELTPIINVDFKSWGASEEANSAFWVSDRELIIKAFPIDNYGHDSPNYQYIKLTIL